MLGGPFLPAGQLLVLVARLQHKLEQTLEPEHAVRVVREVEMIEGRIQGEHVDQDLQTIRYY